MLLPVALCLLPLLQAAVPDNKEKACDDLCNTCEVGRKAFGSICLGKSCDCYNLEGKKIETKNSCPQRHNIFCPEGQEIAKNECPTGVCRIPKKCENNKSWWQKCTGKHCPYGYKLDAQGCPTCECECQADLKIVLLKCLNQCKGDNFKIINNNCPVCMCMKSKESPEKVTEKYNMTRNDGCPKIDMQRDCPQDCAVEVIKDPKTGCPRCSCSKDSYPYWCPAPPKCKASCGKYGYKLNSKGCQESCQCQCPKLEIPKCKGQDKLMTELDPYGCPSRFTCQGKWWCAEAPKCHNNCEKFGYRMDKNGCQISCECNCPKIEDCPKHCSLMEIRADESGCKQCLCKKQKKNECLASQKCYPGSCGVYGYVKDEYDCQVGCKCNCPKFDYLKNCPKCAKSAVIYYDNYGCKACKCETWLRAEYRRAKCAKELDCARYCGVHEAETIRDDDSCPVSCKCKCRDITEVMISCQKKCKKGQYYHFLQDKHGCFECECRTREPVCPKAIKCSNNCGRYGYKTDGNGCQNSCECNCPKVHCISMCRQWGFANDEFGCRTCSCCENPYWKDGISFANKCKSGIFSKDKKTGCPTCTSPEGPWARHNDWK